MEKFDVCIIGAGIGGLMAAHKIKVHDQIGRASCRERV